MPVVSRRSALAGIGATALIAAAPLRPAALELARIEAGLGGRLGVAAVNLGTGARIGHREGERFAMCSTFKVALVALVLAEVDAGRAALAEPIRFGKADLLPHSPITGAHVAQGLMTLGELCAAAIGVSDNAANLLLRRFGGPARLTAFLRRIGDPVTRLDRTETALNENLPGDPRDTTTPGAMIGTMRRILFGAVLSAHGRAVLQGWMRACTTGLDRLRAGLPSGWIAGDKSGTGANGAYNDVAFALPRRGGAPLLIACYIDAPRASDEAASAAHAAIARIVARRLV